MLQWSALTLDRRSCSIHDVPVGTLISPEASMELAVASALSGAGAVSPNPMVGVVAVDAEHRYLGRGAHLAFGGPHAEAALIEDLRKRELLPRLSGGTVYVTLEPCAHVGKTPACAQLLASFPLKRVVYGQLDPFPLVNGKGIALLQSAGIECVTTEGFHRQTEPLTASFMWGISRKTPYVGLKAAISLDGIAGYEGSERFWITGSDARAYGHWLRLYYDAVIVGAGTIIADNPTLDCRHPDIKGRTPKRFVLDPTGRALVSCPMRKLNLFSKDPDSIYWVCREPTWISQKAMAAAKAITSAGGHCISLSANAVGEGVVAGILAAVAQAGAHSLLIEGGPRLWSLFLEAKQVNRLHLFQNPRLFGTEQTLNWIPGLPLSQPLSVKDPVISPLGEDWVVEGILDYAHVGGVP